MLFPCKGDDAPIGHFPFLIHFKNVGTVFFKEFPDIEIKNPQQYIRDDSDTTGSVYQACFTKTARQARKIVDNLDALRKFLKDEDWVSADTETHRLMYQYAEQKETNYFPLLGISKIPHEYLIAIDLLWLNYSNWRYGFTIQSQLWNEVKHNKDDFLKVVGWRNANGEKISHSDAVARGLTERSGYFPMGRLHQLSAWEKILPMLYAQIDLQDNYPLISSTKKSENLN